MIGSEYKPMVVERDIEILPDNEETFILMLCGIIESVDELSHVDIRKINGSYHFRIAPSLPKYNNMLLEEILNFHNSLGIRIELGKSIKTSGSLSFSIKI